ncbi:carbohydrate kinase [Sphingobacterium oryzagri]|uniref:Carbohydrate kinase n=1 Tax=Sphingobacterium oryzagri TaxID=3025669 RepID=A0ABY7WCZ6_9SPHI|nr:carbohydrate kinase [Sphingobacterium sp. KACC 22765]WDF67340.1 carbohydrate kinase [Sphingobacterium sp. KACC 22765]
MILKQPYVVCYGEILWDVFPQGSKAGGAPFNVAYNLSRMGFDVNMISRIGDDERGSALIHKIEDWGLNTANIQVDLEKPTSTVQATFDENNEASYEIINDVAWDRIALLPEHPELVSQAEAFIFGSLCARNPISRSTLFSLLEHAKFRVFDVNFRPPFVDPSLILEILYKTDLLKTNKAELKEMLTFVGKNYSNEDDAARYVQDHFDIPELLLTKGSKGAKYYRAGKIYQQDAFSVEIADTVGSGDAFLAGFLSKRLKQADPEVVLKQAIALGAFITARIGGTPDYNYQQFTVFRDESDIKPAK